MKKLVVYVDMDGVLCDYRSAYHQKVLENPDIKYPQSQYGFFRNLSPIEGALPAIAYLKKQKTVDLYLLTAPSIRNPLSYTEKREWVENHLGMSMVERLIISPHKGLNKGDYLIDDNTEGSGQEDFEGELIHFGSDQFPAWDEVIHYLSKAVV